MSCSKLLYLLILILVKASAKNEEADLLNTTSKFIGDLAESLYFDQCFILTSANGTQRGANCVELSKKLIRSHGVVATCADSEADFKYSGKRQSRKKLIVLNLLALSVGSELHNLFDVKSFIENYHRYLKLVVLVSEAQASKIVQHLTFQRGMNYKYVLATYNTSEQKIALDYVYWFTAANQTVVQPFGKWSFTDGLQVDWNKYSCIQDFQGAKIRITTLAGPPVVYVNEDANGYDGSGFLPDIVLDTVKIELNFTYDLTVPRDQLFGSPDESGNWSGMVGELQRQEVDMAMMSFGLTEGRKLVMGFSPAVEYSSTRLLLRKDQESPDFKWNAYTKPFTSSVWLAIPVVTIVGSLAMTVIIISKNVLLIFKAFCSSLWLLATCFTQKGVDVHSAVNRLPCRIVLASFWILAVVLYSSYTARLTAFLAAVTEDVPVNSLAEAVASSWKIGMVKGSSVPDRVKTSEMPEMKALWSKVSADTSVYVANTGEAMDRIFSERFIFFTGDLIPSFMVKDNCSFAWVPGKYFSGFGHMGYQTDLPFADSISNQVSKVRESGQMKRLLRKWWGTGSSCSSETGSSEFPGMSLHETVSAFALLFTGGCIAGFLLFTEVTIKWKGDSTSAADGEKALSTMARPKSGSRCLGSWKAIKRKLHKIFGGSATASAASPPVEVGTITRIKNSRLPGDPEEPDAAPAGPGVVHLAQDSIWTYSPAEFQAHQSAVVLRMPRSPPPPYRRQTTTDARVY